MTDIAKILQERATYSVSHKAEFEELHRRYVAAISGPDTPENLAERVGVWRRAERLWNPNIGSGGSPDSPQGGTPVAAREPARLAA